MMVKMQIHLQSKLKKNFKVILEQLKNRQITKLQKLKSQRKREQRQKQKQKLLKKKQPNLKLNFVQCRKLKQTKQGRLKQMQKQKLLKNNY